MNSMRRENYSVFREMNSARHENYSVGKEMNPACKGTSFATRELLFPEGKMPHATLTLTHLSEGRIKQTCNQIEKFRLVLHDD